MSTTATEKQFRLLDDERNRFIQDLVAAALKPALDQFQEAHLAEIQDAAGDLKRARRDFEESASRLASHVGNRLDAIEEIIQEGLQASISQIITDTAERQRDELRETRDQLGETIGAAAAKESASIEQESRDTRSLIQESVRALVIKIGEDAKRELNHTRTSLQNNLESFLTRSLMTTQRQLQDIIESRFETQSQDFAVHFEKYEKRIKEIDQSLGNLGAESIQLKLGSEERHQESLEKLTSGERALRQQIEMQSVIFESYSTKFQTDLRRWLLWGFGVNAILLLVIIFGVQR